MKFDIDTYIIKRIVWPNERYISSLSHTLITYPNYYMEDTETGCILSVEEYNEIKKSQVHFEFCNPYPDNSCFMNYYYGEIRDAIEDEFRAKVDCIRSENIFGKQTVPNIKYKVLNGELVVIDDEE